MPLSISKEEEFTGIKVVSLSLALAGVSSQSAADRGMISQLTGWAAVSAPVSMLTYAFMLIASKRLLRTYDVWTMLVTALGFATLFWLFVNPPWVVLARGYGLSDWGDLSGICDSLHTSSLHLFCERAETSRGNDNGNHYHARARRRNHVSRGLLSGRRSALFKLPVPSR